MSKKITLKLVCLTSMFCLFAVLLARGFVTAQQTAPVVKADGAKSLAVSSVAAEVLKETSEIRELPILYAVKSGAQSRAEIERMVIRNLDEETTPAEMRASELTLKKHGMVPADFQYRPFIINLLREQVAGYYDPKAKQFYLADWLALESQMVVMSHELTHALQDQHFNLIRFQKWPKGNGDAELAAHALIEGDATLTMIQYVRRKPERLREFMTSMGSSSGADEEILNAPRVLRETLLFPYEKGSQFVTRLYARGGWKVVSQAFTDLPQSTEQILHADKYFAREAPLKVDIQDIKITLGRGWKRVAYDVNGEWGYYLILDEYLKSYDDSERAAAGWGGDRYAVYEGPSGEIMMAQLSVWDTEQDANEFYVRYLERSKRRYQPASPVEIAASIQIPVRQATMETNEGRVLIAQTGNRVLVLEGVPDGANLNLLRNGVMKKSVQEKA